jgi:hypothetical protein
LFFRGKYVAPGWSFAAVERPEIKRFLLTAGCRNSIELFVDELPKSICVKPANKPLQSAASIVPRWSKKSPASSPVRRPGNVTTA